MTDELELWRAYRRTGDPGIRDRLVERHLPLVKYLAARMAGRLPRHVLVDELYSAGLLGFLAAVDDYDPDVGVAFPHYAAPRVRGSILDELRRLDVVPRGVRRRIREAERALEAIAGRLQREPTDEEVAAELGIDLDAYRQLLGAGVSLVPLEAPSGGATDLGEPAALEDAATPGPHQVLAARERRRLLADLIDRLPPRERQVLALYYREELTMREVGEVLGITESRVSQLHSGAVLRLRAALRRQRVREADLMVPPPARAGNRR